MDIHGLLKYAKTQGASDLHISAGEPPTIRIHGDIHKANTVALKREDVRAMLYNILGDRQRKTFEENSEIDLSMDFPGIARFRVNAFCQERGDSIVFRIIPTKVPSAEELCLPPIVNELTTKERGLILVTGPTGCGKSTTLATMIEYINEHEKLHIITVEDPIEFVYEPRKCLINQRELGTHTHSFANALRSALREDPDVILVGEMRDLETISLALTAAETGHLVLATLHTSGAAKTVDRVIDVFPPNQQNQVRSMFSESIQAVLSQALIKRADGRGRVPALEVMIGTPAIKNLIREGKVAQIRGMMQTGRDYGMQTMDNALVDLYRKGVVNKEAIVPLLSSPEALKSYEVKSVS